MRLTVLTLLALLIAFPASAQDTGVDIGGGWHFDKQVVIPALKVIESQRENAQLDAIVFNGIGGGVCWAKFRDDKKVVSIGSSVLLSGDAQETGVFDVGVMLTVGFYDDWIVFGIGRDFGEITERSRYFGMVGIGGGF